MGFNLFHPLAFNGEFSKYIDGKDFLNTHEYNSLYFISRLGLKRTIPVNSIHSFLNQGIDDSEFHEIIRKKI